MAEESVLFTYVAPFVGVLLVAVGIGGAVPGGYAIIQEDITSCDQPTIAVEGAAESPLAFNETSPNLTRFRYEDLSGAEREAFRSALEDPVGEARVDGSFPHAAAFRNGSVVSYEGERHYVTIVAENPCYTTPPLQFPLGVFTIIFGVVGILSPPLYRKLIELEERANVE